MNQREGFLETAGGGRGTSMYRFIAGLLGSVESGHCNNIAGSHYSIILDGSRIKATTTTYPRSRRDYSWEASR